jgi:ATP-dependent Clp protease ATP-binding subunit ClpA
VGTYEERLQDLQGVLAAQPDIVLFVDEVHVLFRSAMHHHDPFSAADESFKRVLSSGRMCALGCTTSVEYRHYIAPDPALARRFEVVALPTPTPAQTRVIARAKLPGWAAQHGLRIPEELADMAVDLSEERIPSRLQPDKALRLLEDACAVAMTAEPPAATLTAAHLEEALRDSQGYCEAWAGDLDEHQIFARLTARLHGQDDVLRRVSSAFLAGLGTWRHSGGPRGVFLFAGPTGVGKTECAKALAGILGGQRADPIRVDCNTLQAAPHDPGPALNRLLGVPRGYVGYVPGEGGVLSRVRDQPAGVVLFDEIEKAPPCVGQVLLQILDEGRVEDSEGNLLDFRHAFLVLTTNAGCSYRARVNLPAAGFGIASRRDLGRVEAHATEASVRAALLELGLGQEFLARIERVFVFHAIEGPAAGTILRAQLAALAARVGERGYRLEWSEDLASHLLAEWQTSFGVRHLTTILANRVEEQLSLADARGELSGVKTIRLDMLAPQPGLSPELASGLACSRRDERDPAALRILLG